MQYKYIITYSTTGFQIDTFVLTVVSSLNLEQFVSKLIRSGIELNDIWVMPGAILTVKEIKG